MTTICYRSGVLAADTQIAYPSYTNGYRDKFERCGRYMVALAGSAWLRKPLEQWAADGCSEDAVPAPLIDNEDQFSALLIDVHSGQAYEFNNGFLVPIFADYTAIGSGAMFALGAMAHGASAVEAVEAAARHDMHTGGPVTSLSIV